MGCFSIRGAHLGFHLGGVLERFGYSCSGGPCDMHFFRVTVDGLTCQDCYMMR